MRVKLVVLFSLGLVVGSLAPLVTTFAHDDGDHEHEHGHEHDHDHHSHIDGEGMKAIDGLINNLRRAANEVTEAAGKNDKAGAEANLGKAVSVMDLIEKRLRIMAGKDTGSHNHETEHPHGDKCSAPDVTFEITSKQYLFDPSLLKAKQGQSVCIKLTSMDVEHGILIEGYNVHVHGTKEKKGEVQFVANLKGEFNFVCHQLCGSGHPDMKGKLVVE